MWGIALLLAAQAASGAPAPRASLCEGGPARSAGVLDVRLGEPLAIALARSTYRFRNYSPPTGIHSTGERLDLRYRDGERLLELPGIGGTFNTWLTVNENPAGNGIAAISFTWQDRPLTLSEAMDRAIILRSWFVAGGFRAQPVVRGLRDSRGFRVGYAPNALAGPRDRAAAEAMLADERLPAMALFQLRRGGQAVAVGLENWRRVSVATGQGGADAFRACHGREWGLRVDVTGP